MGFLSLVLTSSSSTGFVLTARSQLKTISTPAMGNKKNRKWTINLATTRQKANPHGKWVVNNSAMDWPQFTIE